MNATLAVEELKGIGDWTPTKDSSTEDKGHEAKDAVQHYLKVYREAAYFGAASGFSGLHGLVVKTPAFPGVRSVGSGRVGLKGSILGVDKVKVRPRVGRMEKPKTNSQAPEAIQAVFAADGVQIFESAESMRGTRRYTDAQMKLARRATAERTEPTAAPVPLDD